MVNAVSPRRGNQRMAARVQREHFERVRAERENRPRRDRSEFSAGGFQSAEHSRDSRSWMTSQLSPDSALEFDRQTMIERADSAVKNYELATNHVEGRVIRVAGCEHRPSLPWPSALCCPT